MNLKNKKKKRLKTSKNGEYAIKTFAVRGKLLDWLEAQENESETIRKALTIMMERE